MIIISLALFANWSVLSNITAYFVLLFHSAYRRGNFVRVLDGDNYIEGYISNIGVFNTQFITEDREIIIYPNNLLLGRPTQINPRSRFNSIGKIPKPDDKNVNDGK
ncbi:mechanosensitive ion channel family protein [Pseudoalteromonas sp. SMS1]|uniref:mechanosensitive ion channel domain-containing protein n=1 Tax=Pseudoalteromonas sp. SMS1 TaxID=2908894 RepID=UPI001F1658AF|nr:mechanosensitive ion channel domain-containing protein [Pseudoalteromonas sp. SMS1]MCF2857184.1 mechanosensitive ion channel family protein [Pseudoalteromonas sp. SMS1]